MINAGRIKLLERKEKLLSFSLSKNFTKNALECSDLWSGMKSAKAAFPQVL